MFFDTSHIAIEADHHRRELLADAANFRLARLARAARSRVEPVRAPVRAATRAAVRATVGQERDSDRRNDAADCRYAVSR